MESMLSKQKLAAALAGLGKRLGEIESQVEGTLANAAEHARRRMRQLVGPQPVDGQRREQLIRALAELKSQRRGDGQAVAHWLEAEEEVDLLLREMGLHD